MQTVKHPQANLSYLQLMHIWFLLNS